MSSTRKKLANTPRQRLRKEGRYRAVCDYIACMTDRYLMAEHARLLGGGK